MKITKEIFQVGGGRLTAPEDAAIYLISFGGQAALVDAGCGKARARLLANIRACGVMPEQIGYLFITHCHYDHTGGVKALKDLLRCQVVAHALEAPFLEAGDNVATAATWYGARLQPFQVDHQVVGKEEDLVLGGRTVRALHTPGHSPGSMVYLTESENLKVLFAQDVHGPLHPDLQSNQEDYRRSLEFLLTLEADILCEGHYGVYQGKKKVADFIRRFL